MSSAETRRSWQPWPERVFGKSRLSPLAAGLAVGFFSLAVLLLVTGLSGEMRDFSESGRGLLQQRDARLALSLCALLGFLPASQWYLLRFTRSNLRALEPLVGRGAELLELARPGFWTYILPAILLVPAIAYGIDRDLSFYFQPEYLASPVHYFQWGAGLFCTINAMLTIHLTLSCANAVGNRADAIGRIDLLDLAALTPFARQSLQTLLVWLIFVSIFSVNAGDPDFLLPLLLISAIAGTSSALAAARCNHAIHLRILQAKHEEMARVNAALRGEPGAQARLQLGASEGGEPLSTADLFAYRRFVEESREWALDTSAWLRSALYLAIPLGSWLGGAIVERALEASLQ